MPRKLKYKHKHPPKIHVWAGISKRGATKIVMFRGIMMAIRYSDILSASLVPFLKENYPHIICIKTTILNILVSMFNVFCGNRIQWWKSPAESPDLNPIELLWGSMKTFT